MTRYELFGPWTGAALNPSPRRKWLKHRFTLIAVSALVAISVAASVAIYAIERNASARLCADPHRVYSWKGGCP